MEGARPIRGVRLGLRLACGGLAIVRGALRLGGCDGLRVWTAVPVTAAGQMRDGRAFWVSGFDTALPNQQKTNERHRRGE